MAFNFGAIFGGGGGGGGTREDIHPTPIPDEMLFIMLYVYFTIENIKKVYGMFFKEIANIFL